MLANKISRKTNLFVNFVYNFYSSHEITSHHGEQGVAQICARGR